MAESWQDTIISLKEVADAVRRSERRIQQLAPRAIKGGYAKKVGRITVFHPCAINRMKKLLDEDK